jgi:hypothetical protein
MHQCTNKKMAEIHLRAFTSVTTVLKSVPVIKELRSGQKYRLFAKLIFVATYETLFQLVVCFLIKNMKFCCNLKFDSVANS